MVGLSKRQSQILELAVDSADDKIVAMNLGITEDQVRSQKTKVRRKVAAAEKFLRDVHKYRQALYPKRKYKGI